MDTSQWPQGIGVGERKARPEKDQAINCPRCNSTNTKFCYYNNYSLTQPRYFCKTCRRYWTEGGSLRNVPVGGGSRKNKRSSTTSSSATTTTPSSSSSKKMATSHDHHHHHQTSTIFPPPHSSSQNPKIHQGQDLKLAIFPPSDHDYSSNINISKFMEFPISFNSNTKGDQLGENTSSSLSTMEFLKNNGISSRGIVTNSFMSMPNYANGFGLHELKVPTLNFSLQGFESGYHQEGVHGDHVQLQDTNNAISSTTTTANNGLFFSNEDLIKKQVNHPSANTSTDHEFEQGRGHADSTSYWNGILGGGSWLNQ